MGRLLLEAVDYLKKNSKGLANLDLARLNLRVGKPLSRMAATMPDDKATVDATWAAVHEILNSQQGGDK